MSITATNVITPLSFLKKPLRWWNSGQRSIRTRRGNFCEIAQCRELPCTHGGSCTQRKVWEKLKAYEDLGLEPEDYKCTLNIDIIVRAAAIALGVPVEQLCNIVKLGKAGRLMVLPEKGESDG